MKYTHFYNDYEKMLDFKTLTKEEFLQSYSYLTEEEYDMTSEIVKQKGGASSYEVSSHILESMCSRNEILFRMAVSHLMDVGIRNLTIDNVESACDEIMKEDDSHSFMTNDYQCCIVRTAAQLARIDHIHLLVYISHNIYYDVGQKAIDYDRLKQIANDVMDWIICDGVDSCENYNTFSTYCHIDDDELKELGFGYLIPQD